MSSLTSNSNTDTDLSETASSSEPGTAESKKSKSKPTPKLGKGLMTAPAPPPQFASDMPHNPNERRSKFGKRKYVKVPCTSETMDCDGPFWKCCICSLKVCKEHAARPKSAPRGLAMRDCDIEKSDNQEAQWKNKITSNDPDIQVWCTYCASEKHNSWSNIP